MAGTDPVTVGSTLLATMSSDSSESMLPASASTSPTVSLPMTVFQLIRDRLMVVDDPPGRSMPPAFA